MLCSSNFFEKFQIFDFGRFLKRIEQRIEPAPKIDRERRVAVSRLRFRSASFLASGSRRNSSGFRSDGTPIQIANLFLYLIRRFGRMMCQFYYNPAKSLDGEVFPVYTPKSQGADRVSVRRFWYERSMMPPEFPSSLHIGGASSLPVGAPFSFPKAARVHAETPPCKFQAPFVGYYLRRSFQ